MRGWFSILMLAALSLPAAAEPAARISILSYGTYSVENEVHEPSAADPTGRRGRVTGVRLIEQVDYICARLGVRFGIEYALAPGSTDPGLAKPLRLVMRFPEEGIVNDKGQRFLTSDWDRILVPGLPNVSLYHFEESWEMVPGPWSFEFYDGDVKIAEQKFTVSTRCGIS